MTFKLTQMMTAWKRKHTQTHSCRAHTLPTYDIADSGNESKADVMLDKFHI